MIRLRRVQKGEDIQAEEWNAVLAAIEERTPLNSPGSRLNCSPHGFRYIGEKSSIKSVADKPHSFQYRPATFVGEGEPPADQWRKFQARPGAISHAGGVVFPDNLADVFTASAAGLTYCWLRADFTAEEGQPQPALVGITLDAGSELPEVVWETDAELGTYPASSYLLLFTIEIEDDAIKEIIQYVKTSLSLTLVVNSVSCGQSNSTLFWAKL